jgi:hypothetical protein
MNPMTRTLVALSTLLPGLAATPLHAESAVAEQGDVVESSLPTPMHGRYSASGNLVVRANPMGAILFAGLAYCRPYRFDAERKVESAAIQFGLGAAVNGAFAQGGPFIEWMPVLPVQLRAQYDVYGFSGKNGSLLSFPTADSSFGDDVISARAGTEQRTWAQRFLVRPTLRLKIGRIVLRNQTDFARYQISGEGPYFFEREYDTLLKATDYLVSSRTGLLFVIKPGRTAPGFALGPAYEVTYARGAGLTRQRIGVQGSFIPDLGPGLLAGFRIYGMAGVNLQDHNRNHEPFLMIGVGSDLNL